MYVDRIEVTFDCGHRLLGYNGPCGVPHGHTYKAELLLQSPRLDQLGLLVDFTTLKARLKEWIDQHWDHGFLLNDRDEELKRAFSTVKGAKLFGFKGENPSAEVMARCLFQTAREMFGDVVHSARVWESPTQYGEYFEE